ncbi:hypothetical protein FN846DRAFT_1022147 [Sphaerosporella brunnea]|uniref:Uncharacterized protein n=1 Tax=Sphaerosporella brunnea TaxID=1250544 RepID=A0A5J5EUS9_9PEZI|nr:hypothetical protein FN846DRAFT_1022147 [Sphaerosporella brunnea]
MKPQRRRRPAANSRALLPDPFLVQPQASFAPPNPASHGAVSAPLGSGPAHQQPLRNLFGDSLQQGGTSFAPTGVFMFGGNNTSAPFIFGQASVPPTAPSGVQANPAVLPGTLLASGPVNSGFQTPAIIPPQPVSGGTGTHFNAGGAPLFPPTPLPAAKRVTVQSGNTFAPSIASCPWPNPFLQTDCDQRVAGAVAQPPINVKSRIVDMTSCANTPGDAPTLRPTTHGQASATAAAAPPAQIRVEPGDNNHGPALPGQHQPSAPTKNQLDSLSDNLPAPAPQASTPWSVTKSDGITEFTSLSACFVRKRKYGSYIADINDCGDGNLFTVQHDVNEEDDAQSQKKRRVMTPERSAAVKRPKRGRGWMARNTASWERMGRKELWPKPKR